MATVPHRPNWKHGELGPGTWYTADGHTAEDLPMFVIKGVFRDQIPWPVLTTGLYAQLVFGYLDDVHVGDPLELWPSYASRRIRLRLPRNLAAQLLLDYFRDDQRHPLAYDNADHTTRVFLPQVTGLAFQDDPDWLWLDVERPDDPAVSPLDIYTVGVIHKPERAGA
jgi:hypothetical protein